MKEIRDYSSLGLWRQTSSSKVITSNCGDGELCAADAAAADAGAAEDAGDAYSVMRIY